MWDEVLLCISDLGMPLNLFKMGIISQDCCEDSSKYVLCADIHSARHLLWVHFYSGTEVLHVSAALFWLY